ncbi:tyrosine-type recombinase/integrase [Flagellimonas olearia]|uniref:Tyrosine-type recombinase/integrase n=1 Tax=Flagellimonas olearia TaxID=552546 RepID=A0A444VM62_9FLAO|nr:phage integrase SAM-like domain-containing protein [Allomuricauda olearia]RYC51871.1 hypothetical protein DN53_08255 [Allomuricauda olearia]
MANVKLIVKSTKNPSEIYVRFYRGKELDITSKSGFLINPKFWHKKGYVKNMVDSQSSRFLNEKLPRLKEHIINTFNESYNQGKIINKKWLDSTVMSFHSQPLKDEENEKFYFTPFFEVFVDDKEKEVSIKTGKKLSDRTIKKYKGTLNVVKAFESERDVNLRWRELDSEFHKSFLDYMTNDLLYNRTNASKHLSIINQVCSYAKSKGIELNPYAANNKFSLPRDKTYDPYLNIQEIKNISSLDFSDNPRLDNARDWLLIGVWTGLRISDILELNSLQIQTGRFQIMTEKVSDKVVIPIHPDVQTILDKRGGNFPKKISDQKFNDYIKEIGELAGLTESILGGKKVKVTLPNGEETFRKRIDYYPKYELISSHICRRSFATNHYGKIPNKTIRAITGHSSDSMLERYLKQSHLEHVIELEEYWAKQFSEL